MTDPVFVIHGVGTRDRQAFENRVAALQVATSAGTRHFTLPRPRGLLEPCARTTRTYGSEGAGAQQRAPATRPLGMAD